MNNVIFRVDLRILRRGERFAKTCHRDKNCDFILKPSVQMVKMGLKKYNGLKGTLCGGLKNNGGRWASSSESHHGISRGKSKDVSEGTGYDIDDMGLRGGI